MDEKTPITVFETFSVFWTIPARWRARRFALSRFAQCGSRVDLTPRLTAEDECG
jgi:hypothetical protein